MFSSEYKSTLKSFETFHSVINSKSQSTKDYDSTYLTLYIADDYTVCLYSKDPSKACAQLEKPKKDCKSEKGCLCLFEGEVVKKCLDIDGVFDIGAYQMYTIEISQYVNFQGMPVGGGNTEVKKKTFNSIIVAVQNVNNKPRILYVWQENDVNVALDKELSKPLCPNNDNICYKQKQDELLKGTSLYSKVFEECLKSHNKETIVAKCSFSNNRCDLSCIDMDMGCANSIQKCSDYSRYSDDGLFSNYFIVKDSPSEWMCMNDITTCKVSGTNSCKISEPFAFVCSESKPDNCNAFINNDASKCNVTLYGYTLAAMPIIGFYEDKSNKDYADCKKAVEQYFDKTEILACKYSKNCNEFLLEVSMDDYKDCDFLFMVTGGAQTVLLEYDSSKNICKSLVEQYFEKAQVCIGS